MKIHKLVFILTAVAALVGRASGGAEITVNFTGHVFTHNPARPLFGDLSPPILAGDPVNSRIFGFFTYDTSTPDTLPVTTFGRYNHTAGGAFELVFADGTKINGSTTPLVHVKNDHFGENQFQFFDGDTGQGTMLVDSVLNTDAVIQFSLNGGGGITNLFGSDQLPVVFPSLDQFTGGHTFALLDIGSGRGAILMQLNSLTQIPEPSTALLALLATLGICVCRRRRRSAA